MTVKLVTDVLASGLDKNYRENLVSNFKAIETALNSILESQKTIIDQLGSLAKQVNDDKDSIKTMSQQNTDNIQALVNILTEYDVPMKLLNGKIVEDEED